LYYAPWCGHCKNLKPIWEELALHVLGSDIVVAQIDLTANALKSPEVEGYPTMYFYPKEGESKKYDSGRSLNDFRKFLFDNSAAYREAFPEEDANHVKKLKSQDPQPDDENIKVLVASSHNQAVYDKSKDTLVMYYAPWCGHCKKLAPHWKDLAKEVQGTNVVIAKIDMTENEIEGLRITSFPTIFFYPAGGERVAFDGGRDLNKLMEWLSKNSD
jgi:protein disulfide-isomerase-like protein